MTDTEKIEQLCYTWSDVGLSTLHAGFRIRAASPGLTEIYSERVKSMDRYMRYVLPPGTDRFAITPDMAPVCLAFIRTEWGEYILVHKKYVGEDGFGRLGNFFIHLFAFGPDSSSRFSAQGTQACEEFSAQNAIWFWESDIWKTSDQQLDRRSNHLDTVLLDELYDYQRFRPQYAHVHSYLPFLIEAYLMRQPEQQIYIAAAADSTAMIASLITGLTDCLPRQLLAGLTFSTYEADVTKATAQIVGTSWIPTPGTNGSATPVFAPLFYREKLAVNCSTREQSPLQGHPLTVNTQTRVRLAPEFARYAADCLVANNMKALYDLIEQAEKDPQLTIERFLLLYESEIRNKGTLSQDNIEGYLDNPLYQVEKLSDPQFRESILEYVTSNPTWWETRLRSHFVNLQEQSRKPSPKRTTVTDTGQRQKKRVSAQEPPKGRKRKGEVQPEQPSLTLAEALALLARNAIPRVVSAMEKSTALEQTATVRDAAYEATHRKYLERIATLLDLMNCSLPAEETTRVWKELLDAILARPGACSFLTTNWDILAWLLKRWNAAFPSSPGYDQEISHLLVVPWSHLGEFLKLHLRERHGEWNVFVVDDLIRDDSLTPQIAHYLGQNYGEEITELLSQLAKEQRWWVRAAQFVTKLSNNDYPGKPKYYNLIEELLGFLVKLPQYRLLAKDVVVALTLSGHSGTLSYLRQVETLLGDLLKNGQQEQKEGMDLFNTLVKRYDKERFAPIVLQANLGLVKQVYPTQEEQAMFFAENGSRYLSTPEHIQVMMSLYSDLLHSPGRAGRLMILLRISTKEKFVLTVLNKAPLEKDEQIAVLKNYGKEYLEDYQHSPRLAKFVVDSYSWLRQTGYPAKELLFALFTPNTSPLHLEELLTSAQLSAGESVQFFKTYGNVEAYFPFFYQSSATLGLLNGLAQKGEFSATKMQVVFSWLAPSQLRLALRAEDVEGILQAAALTPAEQQQFLERSGQTYLPYHQHFPIILEYVVTYLSTFTADALERPEAKKLIAFLWRLAPSLPLDSQTQQYIRYWGTINQYFDVPTAIPGTLKALAASLASLGLPKTSVFEAKLVAAFARCVEQTDDLITIMQHVELIPKLKSNSLQLLYSIAEECAKLHGQRIEALLPCLLFVLSMPDMNKRQQHFTQQFLDRLLYHVNDLASWHTLDWYVRKHNLSEVALKRWQYYLHWLELSDKITSDQDTASGSGASKVSSAVNVPTSTSHAPGFRRPAVIDRYTSSLPAWLGGPKQPSRPNSPNRGSSRPLTEQENTSGGQQQPLQRKGYEVRLQGPERGKRNTR